MSIKYKFTDKEATYFVTSTVVGWADLPAGRQVYLRGMFTEQFWIHENHPVLLGDAAMLRQRMDYLHENPVRAGFVLNPEHWLYSSALDYYTMNSKGLLDSKCLVAGHRSGYAQSNATKPAPVLGFACQLLLKSSGSIVSSDSRCIS